MTYFASPYPLSEEHYLVAWSDQPLKQAGDEHGGALGIYLFDAFGNLNLLYRDPTLSCMYPLPVRPRPRPPQVGSQVTWDGPQEGRMLVADVYRGMESIPPGSIRRLRIVGVPAKAQPDMNEPVLGVAQDDPGKFVLGTVPVEPDGSAFFRVPSGVSLYLQALDEHGMAVQTMRTVTYVQPGETVTCIGCHEPRNLAPPNRLPLAARRDPSKLQPGVAGSWPLDYRVLMQPVLERRCVACHRPGAEAAEFDLTADKSYPSLVDYGQPSLRTHVLTRYRQGRSTVGGGAAQTSPLVTLLRAGHYQVQLDANEWERVFTWLDLYGQRLGSFSDDQEQRLRQFRTQIASLLAE
jgi:mono/diheme cytochrome c family protein